MLTMMLISVTRGSRFWEIQSYSNLRPLVRATYHTQVASISEQGNKSTTKFPVKEKAWGDKKARSLWAECCRLKGKTQQEASIFRMAVAAGCKVKASFLWAVWRVEVLEAGSEGAAEIKHLGWMKSLYHSLFLNIFCVRVQKGWVRSKSNLR